VLDPKNPVTMGPVGVPEIYTEARYQAESVLNGSKKVIVKAWKEFAKLYGRSYKPIETYRTEGAEVVLMTMGSVTETAMTAVDRMREKGIEVGLMRFRPWRPFPYEQFRRAVKGIEVLAVMDRAISFGAQGGPVCSKVKSALYGAPYQPQVFGFISGLGGRDITVEMFAQMVKKAIRYAKKGKGPVYELIGVRER